jgi:hypothetical protein
MTPIISCGMVSWILSSHLQKMCGRYNNWMADVARLKHEVGAFYRTCRQCQVWKYQRKKYGHLPAKKAESEPWGTLSRGSCWSFYYTNTYKKCLLLELACIGPSTGWFEVVELPNEQAWTVMEAFNNSWLTRYPHPQLVRFDNGNEFNF